LADTILIYLVSLDDVHAVVWASVDQQHGKLVEHGREPLEQLAERTQGKRLIVALSGSELLLTRAEVPGSNANKAARAVPFALEDKLAGDVDELHFALGARQRDGSFPVAVIAHQRMQRLVALLDEANLQPHAIVPAPLLLPQPPSLSEPNLDATQAGDSVAAVTTWVMTTDGIQVELRSGEFSGFGCDAELLGALLPLALKEAGEAAPSHLRLLTDDEGRAALPPLRIELDEQAIASPLEAFASQLGGKPPIDLQQGDYSRRQQAGKLWKPWKLTAALAAGWLLVAAVGSFIELRVLETESARLDTQMAELLQDTFPDVKRVVNPQSQMRARLKTLRGGGGSGDFIGSMAEVARALGEARNTTLQSVAFRSGRLELDLEADQLATLDKLKQSLEKNGQLSATIQSANQEQGKVRGRVRVEARS
jgi:general secretion pathway protein L